MGERRTAEMDALDRGYEGRIPARRRIVDEAVTTALRNRAGEVADLRAEVAELREALDLERRRVDHLFEAGHRTHVQLVKVADAVEATQETQAKVHQVLVLMTSGRDGAADDGGE